MDKNPRQITRLRMNDQYKIEYLMTYSDIDTASDIIDLSNFSLKVGTIEKAHNIRNLEDVFTNGQEYEVAFVRNIIDGMLFNGDVYQCKGYIVRPVIYQFDNIEAFNTVATLEGDSTSSFDDSAEGFKFTKQENGKLLAELVER